MRKWTLEKTQEALDVLVGLGVIEACGSDYQLTTFGQLIPPNARLCEGLRRTQGGAQRQLQPWPLHGREDRVAPVAEGSNTRGASADQETTPG
jgi:hypothetical protein